MANANSAKGNPASTRMSNPKYKAKRAANKIKNAPKEKHDGKIGLSNLKNFHQNNVIHHENAMHNAQVVNDAIGTNYKTLGLRQVRRILSGKNDRLMLSDEQMRKLFKSALIGVDTFGYAVVYNYNKELRRENGEL